MKRPLVVAVIVGLVLLCATAATGDDPPPMKANGIVNPQPGQVIGYGIPDGADGCKIDDLTLSASPDVGEDVTLAAFIHDDCTITWEAPGKAPEYAPGGKTRAATP